jgi:hypothetical protein
VDFVLNSWFFEKLSVDTDKTSRLSSARIDEQRRRHFSLLVSAMPPEDCKTEVEALMFLCRVSNFGLAEEIKRCTAMALPIWNCISSIDSFLKWIIKRTGSRGMHPNSAKAD